MQSTKNPAPADFLASVLRREPELILIESSCRATRNFNRDRKQTNEKTRRRATTQTSGNPEAAVSQARGLAGRALECSRGHLLCPLIPAVSSVGSLAECIARSDERGKFSFSAAIIVESPARIVSIKVLLGNVPHSAVFSNLPSAITAPHLLPSPQVAV